MQTTNTNSEPFVVKDEGLSKRLSLGIFLSVVANALFLFTASALTVPTPISGDDHTVFVTLVPLRQEARKPPKLARKPAPKPTPLPTPAPRKTPPPVAPTRPIARATPKPAAIPPVSPPRKQRVRTASVQDSHNRVLTAPKASVSRKNDFVVQSGGNARAGQVMTRQGAGNGTVNTATPVPPPVKAADPAPEPKPAPTTMPAPAAPPVRATPTPEPTPAPTPKPSGPTRGAEAVKQENPTIPDSLRDSDFKSFVRVKVEVAEDGSFTVVLRTSSGNPEVDSRVLEALKRWKWKPALKNGEPIASTELFKFEFEVK